MYLEKPKAAENTQKCGWWLKRERDLI